MFGEKLLPTSCGASAGVVVVAVVTLQSVATGAPRPTPSGRLTEEPGVVVVVTLASVTLTLPAVVTVNEKNIESPRPCSLPSNNSVLGPVTTVGSVEVVESLPPHAAATSASARTIGRIRSVFIGVCTRGERS